MDPQVQTKILEHLEVLAEKLGVTVDFLWPLLVTKCQVEAGTAIFAIMVPMVLSIAALFFFLKRNKQPLLNSNNDPTLSGVCAGVLSILSVVFTILFLNGICDNVPRLFIPEPYVIEDLLKLVT